MTETTETIGRAKSVLVFQPSGTAFVTSILAHTLDSASRGRLRFTGDVRFSEGARRHIRRTVLTVADRVFDAMGLSRRRFEISAVNIGAASALDLGAQISGFSADLAVWLAMLSCGLKLPLADDFVATGHLASCQGDIGPVRALSAKVRAVVEDQTVQLFVHPDIEKDRSLHELSPRQTDLGIQRLRPRGGR